MTSLVHRPRPRPRLMCGAEVPDVFLFAAVPDVHLKPPHKVIFFLGTWLSSASFSHHNSKKKRVDMMFFFIVMSVYNRLENKTPDTFNRMT